MALQIIKSQKLPLHDKNNLLSNHNDILSLMRVAIIDLLKKKLIGKLCVDGSGKISKISKVENLKISDLPDFSKYTLTFKNSGNEIIGLKLYLENSVGKSIKYVTSNNFASFEYINLDEAFKIH